MSDAPAAILEFDHATAEPDPGYDAGLFDATFTLTTGALTLIRLEREAVRLPLGDAACGAVELEHGAVRFMGSDWRKMPFHQAIQCRGKIGRTFEGHAWVSNLDVDENVILAQRHHTT